MTSPISFPAPAFEFRTSGRVVFGQGRSGQLPELLDGWGTRALVCTGTRPQQHAELIAALPMPSEVFTVAGEPTVDMARTATGVARAAGADVVVAIGGGSALDLGKAVAMLLGNGGDPLDYLEVIGAGRAISAPSAPFAALPTTAGTGSEVTSNAVLASPQHGRKASLRSAFMLPRLALVDPLLTLGCPAEVTAASGLDALTQCLEPLVSPQATPVTDALAGEGLRRAAVGLRAAYRDRADVAARTDMSLCSVLGGMALANAKLGAVHGFAGVIGGLVDAAHGAICAALLVPVSQANVRALRNRDPSGPALDRYRAAAGVLTQQPGATITEGLDWLRATVELLGVPNLAQLGLRPGSVDDIVAKTRTASSTRGNPVTLTDEELREALLLSMG
jgi:alcohol dehydrogenase class IV